MLNLHLCCGDVLLEGFTNCDIEGKLREECSLEEIEANLTTLDRYYKYPFIKDAKERKSNKRPYIVDQYFKILETWPWNDNSVDQIVLVNAIEHFTTLEAQHIKKEINRVSKVGCKLLISFPNIKATIDKYYESDPKHCFELIYCNHANIYAAHKTGYTPQIFSEFLQNWEFVPVDIINHDYPNWQLVGIKRS